jgi:hypothetical protein
MRTLATASLLLAMAGCSGPAPSTPPAAESPAGAAPAATASPSAAPGGAALPTAAGESAAPAAAAGTAGPASAGGAAPAGTAAPAAHAPAKAPAAAGAGAPASAQSPSNGQAASSGAAAPAQPPAPEYREITIPAGTTLSVALTSAHASDTSAVEEAVRGTLRRAVLVDGAEALPAGTLVGGAVIEAVPAGRVKGRARLALRFTSLTLEEEEHPMATEAIAREARATKGKDAAKIGIGAGAGAVVGAIAGGKKGAVVGGAIGAGAGTGVVLATSGEEVRMAAGSTVSVRLREPLVIRQRVR